MPEGIFLWIVV